MKRQIAGILTGLLVCSAFLAGCGKNEATQAVKESVETEKEGNGESTEAEGKDQDKKSDAEETDGSTEESSGEDQAPEVVLDKIGILLPEERSDMNGSLERAELKSRLEENGYDAALYFAKEDADTQISQIRELLQTVQTLRECASCSVITLMPIRQEQRLYGLLRSTGTALQSADVQVKAWRALP